MILVFGGTTEGKQVASFLDETHIPYYYSTKTEVSFQGKGIPIYGALTKHELEQFCITNKVKCIVNASHPFAEVLHQTVAAIEITIPIIRFEREFTKRINHELVTYVSSIEEAIAVFQQKKYDSLLALSGVQTIHKLTSYWKSNTTWFRILDRDSSRAIAEQANFPSEQLLYGYPQHVKEEILLYKELAPKAIFTKESGVNGKLDQKISAALETQIPIVILKKPLLSNRYLCTNSIEELHQKIIVYIE
ncbi:precorrin-6A/cobalt-precorrin-6A reductase [Tenacibaculum jejuense]|uniref:Precorrin-6A reductase n=1 Tax=Tenacibaculum jejuense TaxID=584609 RepID=A0A238UDA4_9FLAO|nr:precorrin-6A/cobalt-precorrin-6A reductase [Tenacibaculum jejuense]SNR16568.1 Precorrin-6A reductase [Tenacibaculum jejuense]